MQPTMLLLVSVLLLVTACGQKGDLVRPRLPAAEVSSTTEDEENTVPNAEATDTDPISFTDPTEVAVEIEMDGDIEPENAEATDSQALPTVEQ